jgi:predicted O-methyltransferase YrrM
MIEAVIILQIITLGAVLFTARKAFWAAKIAQSSQQTLTHVGLQTTQQLESLERLYLRLDLPRGSLPPTRGWAASPDFLNILYEHLISHRPQSIVECGSGLTTIITGRALQQLGNGRLLSLEHDQHFAEQTRGVLRQLSLQNFVDIRIVSLKLQKVNSAEYLWYDVSSIDLPDTINLITVDGPPEPLVGGGGRYPVGPILFDRLADGGAALFDDAHRPGEKTLINRLLDQFPFLEREDLPAEKGCTRLTKIQRKSR